MALAPDRRTLVTGSNDGSVRIWDVATGELQAGPFPGPLKRAVSDLEISRVGDRFLATVGATVDVRSLSDGELIDRVRAPGPNRPSTTRTSTKTGPAWLSPIRTVRC